MISRSMLVILALALGAAAGIYEFYWDDGVAVFAEVPLWEDVNEPYWFVQFDEEKTGGALGTVLSVGAYVVPGWPDSTYQGVYLYVFGDEDGLPGEELESVYVNGPGWQWADVEVELDSGVFWVAWEYIGHYPECDALGIDAGGTGHTYNILDGFIDWGDAMLRCYWDGEPDIRVVEGTWGRIKALW